MHPFYYSAVAIGLVWSLMSLGWLPFAVTELQDSPWVVLYLCVPVPGLVILVGSVLACSLRIDEDGIRTGQNSAVIVRRRPTPALITWASIRSVTVGVDGSDFALLDIPLLDSIGRSQRLEPVVTYELDAGIRRTVHLWQLGRGVSRRGLAEVCSNVDELRSRAGLRLEPHPTIEQVRLLLKRIDRGDDPPLGYRPRRSR